MKIFDIVAHGDRIVLLADATNDDGGFGLIYTWNRSLTLQCWATDDSQFWDEIDIRTLQEVPDDIDEAIIKVRVWHSERMKGELPSE